MNRVLLLLLAACAGAGSATAERPSVATEPFADRARLGDGTPIALALAGPTGPVLARTPTGSELAWYDGPRATLRVPAPEGVVWERAVVALQPDGTAWIATWAEAGDGPIRVHRLKDRERKVFDLAAPAVCEAFASCDAVVRAVDADGDGGLWLVGWKGVHSNEVAFRGWVAHLGPDGHTRAAWEVVGPAAALAFETSVDAVTARPDGAVLVGHVADPAGGSPDREALWWATIQGTTLSPPAAIGTNPLSRTHTPALAALPDGAAVVVGAAAGGPAVLRVAAGGPSVTQVPLSGVPTAWAIAAQGDTVVAAIASRGGWVRLDANPQAAPLPDGVTISHLAIAPDGAGAAVGRDADGTFLSLWAGASGAPTPQR